MGDEKTIKVAGRIGAATNRNLRDEIKAGRFREDLYYRLSVFPLEVPPLRQRVDDVVPLALHFLEKICREFGRDPLRLTQRQAELLKQQPWPGNIRELKNVIERAVISSPGNRLKLDLEGSVLAANDRVQNEVVPEELQDFMTVAEFKNMEKSNLIATLQHANLGI